MDTWRSGGASGGRRVAVEEEWSEEEDEGSARNWKSAMRRSAHLLAEQVVERLSLLWDFEE